MNYFLFTVYDADYSDIMLYLYNESINNSTNIQETHKKAMSLIAKDMKKNGKDPKKYKANRKLITYKELTKNYINRVKFIEPYKYTDTDGLRHNAPMHYNMNPQPIYGYSNSTKKSSDDPFNFIKR